MSKSTTLEQPYVCPIVAVEWYQIITTSKLKFLNLKKRNSTDLLKCRWLFVLKSDLVLTFRLSDLQLAWAPYLSMCAMIPNVTVLLLNALFGHKIKTNPRLIVSLVRKFLELIFILITKWRHLFQNWIFFKISIIGIFIFTDVMTKQNTDTWQDTFMGVTLLSVVVFNIMVAVLQVRRLIWFLKCQFY